MQSEGFSARTVTGLGSVGMIELAFCIALTSGMHALAAETAGDVVVPEQPVGMDATKDYREENY